MPKGPRGEKRPTDVIGMSVKVMRIAAGEELLLDYKFAKRGTKVPCHCGAPKCRGTINLK